MPDESDRIRVGDRVTIYPRGKKKIWCADFWRDGSHCRQSLKTGNKKIALSRALTLDAQLSTGTYEKPPPPVTLRQTVEDYIKFLELENRAPKTIVKYRGILDVLAVYLEEQGVTRLAQFTPVWFDKFRALRKQDHREKTMSTEGMVIKGLFKWAESRKLLLKNPIVNYKIQKPLLEPKGGPTLTQIDAILAVNRGEFTTMLAVLAFTGMRSGELQRLRKEDQDLDGNWLRVVSRRGAETKTRTSRKVPLHARLRALLENVPKTPGPWLFSAQPSGKFPEGGHWISTKKLNDRFKGVLKRLGLPIGRDGGFTIHSLRHSFENITVNAGIPQRVVDTWQGHKSDKSMAAVYYRLGDAESQDFMKKVPFGTGKPAANVGEEE
jgi:integrase